MLCYWNNINSYVMLLKSNKNESSYVMFFGRVMSFIYFSWRVNEMNRITYLNRRKLSFHLLAMVE
jgi:hypothetical protein